MTVDPTEFADFFRAVNHGYSPFTWQERIVEQALARIAAGEERIFPDVFDLPTGSGKTSLIDVGVFILAVEACRPLAERRMPRRIVFVVDRRVVVDQAYEHARHLADSLERAASGTILDRVATALRSYAGEAPAEMAAPALLATVLRGGIRRDEQWAQRPDQPAIISSTVDQVGSRLLFRGYGVSDGMQPIHAGLLGSDTLFLLDEVHLSQPFAQTLGAIEEYQRDWGPVASGWRWEVAQLSATPAGTAANPFRLDPTLGDLDPEQNEALVRRVRAAKPVEIPEAVKVSATDRSKANETFARALAATARRLTEADHVGNVAVVVNRVDTAVRTFELVESFGEPGAIDALLLTGRMRPWDRDRHVMGRLAMLRTGHARSEVATPLVVVATQCIEAGADLDFDAMVSEVASLDALVQRFGRVDRNGKLSEAGTPAPGVILARSAAVQGSPDPDPVYGTALAATWHALRDRGTVDFGISALPEEFRPPPAALRAETGDAPLLFPGHLDAWVQTWPKPDPDPDPRFWLHGNATEARDVTVVWRADLSEDLLTQAWEESKDGAGGAPGTALSAVRTLAVASPPGALESLAVPIGAVRAWLSGRPAVPVADAELDRLSDSPGPAEAAPRPALRYRGDNSVVVRPGRRERGGLPRDLTEIRPGDVLVVPCTYGGLGRHWSWDPGEREPVQDLAELAQAVQRDRLVLRIVPGVAGLDSSDWSVAIRELEGEDADPELTLAERLSAWITAHASDLSPQVAVVAEALQTELGRRGGGRRRRVQIETIRLDGLGLGGPWFVATMRSSSASSERLRRAFGTDSDSSTGGSEQDEQRPETVDSEPETSSFTAVEVSLDEHLRGVEWWAKLLGQNCGLPREVFDDLALAGRLHDLGKADSRFQVLLRGGDLVAAAGGPLAKSAVDAGAYQARRSARERSGYPQGARHELLSLAMVEHVAWLRDTAHDWDLVLHLVASHHGYCRPFAPAVPDPSPVIARHLVDGQALTASSDHGLAGLDAGVAERFWRLVRRYGWYRLTYYEAILRLADHRRSQYEQIREPDGDPVDIELEEATT